jgi:ubiquinone/menaquinone biosynthesis C-methylase UbiE
MVIPKIAHISNCRVCKSKRLEKFLSLPNMPFTDDFVRPQKFGQEFRADINVYVCEECLSVQTQHDVDVEDYYEDYQYSVGDSTLAKSFMRTLAYSLKKKYYPDSDGRKVLEVGSSDGEQLLAFKETGCQVLGYEPSSLLCEMSEKKGAPTVQGLFTSDSTKLLPPNFKEVDVVMLSYTFDHLPDPISFLHTVTSILNKKDGLLVVEIHNLEKIIERQEFCLFEHEHSIYLTEKTVKNICHAAKLAVIDFDLVPENERRANSLIFIATPAGSDLASQAAKARTPEKFSDINFYQQIGQNIEQGIENLDRFVNQRVSGHQKLVGYGAGGRGVMTLAAMKNATLLAYVVDKRPKGNNLLMPKSGLPIYPISQLSIEPADQILVFSFGYMKEIQQELSTLGYQPHQFHSLIDVLAGRF